MMPAATTLRRIGLNFVFGMMAFLILSGVVLIAWRLFQQHDPIVTTTNAHVVGEHVLAGGVMRVEADFADNGVCQTDTGRFLWRPTADEPSRRDIVILPINNVAFSEPGPNRPTVYVPVPSWIEPGRWFYYARSERTCGLWDRLFGPDIGRTPDSPVWIDAPG